MSLFTMCCGSRKKNHHAPTSHRAPNERPQPSDRRNQPRQLRLQPQPQPQSQSQRRPRDSSQEELEKRKRQAQASAAARSYGWPTERGVIADNMRSNRDSTIEPDLAGGLAAMPGSDFRAVYDPQRPRYLPQQQQQKPMITHQQQTSHQKWQPKRPPYYQQQFVDQQPSRRAPSTTQQQQPRQQRQRPAVGRILPVVPTRPPVQRAPRKAKRPVRRDSNGVSECSSSDDDDDYHKHRRNYNVSPLNSPRRL